MKFARALFLLLLLLPLAGCRKNPDTLVRGDYDVVAMDKAIARARSEVDVFIAVLKANDAESFSVKAPIKDENGTEHFWITDVAFVDGEFEGHVGNDPGIVKNVVLGQKWRIKKTEISDWMYVRAGRIHGGYTIDPLLASFDKAKSDDIRRRLVR